MLFLLSVIFYIKSHFRYIFAKIKSHFQVFYVAKKRALIIIKNSKRVLDKVNLRDESLSKVVA